MVSLAALIFYSCLVVGGTQNFGLEHHAYTKGASEVYTRLYTYTKEGALVGYTGSAYLEEGDSKRVTVPAYLEGDSEEYEGSEDEDSSYESPDHVDIEGDPDPTDSEEDDDPLETPENLYIRKVIKECFPIRRRATVPPVYYYPYYYSGTGRIRRPGRQPQGSRTGQRNQRRRLTSPLTSPTDPLLQSIPACSEFEEDLIKETQAMLIGDGQPCRNKPYPERCRWRYMTRARERLDEPDEMCMTQIREMYNII